MNQMRLDSADVIMAEVVEDQEAAHNQQHLNQSHPEQNRLQQQLHVDQLEHQGQRQNHAPALLLLLATCLERVRVGVGTVDLVQEPGPAVRAHADADTVRRDEGVQRTLHELGHPHQLVIVRYCGSIRIKWEN